MSFTLFIRLSSAAALLVGEKVQEEATLVVSDALESPALRYDDVKMSVWSSPSPCQSGLG